MLFYFAPPVAGQVPQVLSRSEGPAEASAVVFSAGGFARSPAEDTTSFSCTGAPFYFHSPPFVGSAASAV